MSNGRSALAHPRRVLGGALRLRKGRGRILRCRRGAGGGAAIVRRLAVARGAAVVVIVHRAPVRAVAQGANLTLALRALVGRWMRINLVLAGLRPAGRVRRHLGFFLAGGEQLGVTGHWREWVARDAETGRAKAQEPRSDGKGDALRVGARAGAQFRVEEGAGVRPAVES